MANELRPMSEVLVTKLDSVSGALPKSLNKDRFVQNCLAFCNEHSELTKVNQAQVIGGLMKAAYLGLDYMNKECYLIPYGNTVQFQTSYKGERKFVMQYAIRPIKDIVSFVIRKGDFVEYGTDENSKQYFVFKPVPFSREEIIGVAAVVYYEDGQIDYETMTTEDVNNVRTKYSKAANSKAWKESWDEMARKTVLRRICKHLEVSFESVEAQTAFEDGGDCQFDNSPIEKGTGTTDPFAEENIIDTECVDVTDTIETEAKEIFK